MPAVVYFIDKTCARYFSLGTRLIHPDNTNILARPHGVRINRVLLYFFKFTVPHNFNYVLNGI